MADANVTIADSAVAEHAARPRGKAATSRSEGVRTKVEQVIQTVTARRDSGDEGGSSLETTDDADCPYINISDLPLIVVTMPGEGTADDIKGYYRDLRKLLEKHARLAFLIDMSALDASRATADLRRAMADEFTPLKPLFDQVAVAEARVVGNRMTKGVLTAFFWLVGEQVACPARFFTDRVSAVAWLREKMAEEGL